MINGLGFSEVLVILMLVLMFFGSRELPHFIRETARLIAKLRRYSEKVRRELNEVTQLTDVSDHGIEETVTQKKQKLRAFCLEKRKGLTEDERQEKSKRIMDHVFASGEFARARAVMLYAATRTEVQTGKAVREMLAGGKRVVLPYCKPNSTELGIGEITDPETDLVAGEYGLLEPRSELRDNFLKSDLHLVICPGVGFDRNGRRLGRGKGYYDLFCKDLKERVPLFGVAFACQILEDEIPFDYHDIPVDALFTEEGRLDVVR